MEDLAKEARLLKKLKSGKITEKEFDEELENSSSDDEPQSGALSEKQQFKLFQLKNNKNTQKNRKKLLRRKAPKLRTGKKRSK